MRERARPGVVGSALRLGQDLFHLSEELLEGGEVEVDPLQAIDNRGHLEGSRQLRADLLGDGGLDPEQGLAIERVRRLTLGSGDREPHPRRAGDGRSDARPPNR